MIQIGSYINVVDNSGAKIIACLKVPKGYKRQYAYSGDIIVATVKSLRHKFRKRSKVKKGDIVCAIILRTVNPIFNKSGTLGFHFNVAVLLTRHNTGKADSKIKFIGTRVFGGIPKALSRIEKLKNLKLMTLSAGIIR